MTIYMNYKITDNSLSGPASISQGELLKFWAMSKLAPEQKEIIINVLKEFKQRERQD